MAMDINQFRDFILRAFPDAKIEVQDLAGDNDHLSAKITTKAFTGKTRIEQHKLVYAALQGNMGTQLHALALHTQTPTE